MRFSRRALLELFGVAAATAALPPRRRPRPAPRAEAGPYRTVAEVPAWPAYVWDVSSEAIYVYRGNRWRRIEFS